MANFLTSQFWFVTKVPYLATSPVVEDIIFKCTIPELELQFKGGLRGSEIIAIYDNEDAAIRRGTQELWRWYKTRTFREKLEQLTNKKVKLIEDNENPVVLPVPTITPEKEKKNIPHKNPFRPTPKISPKPKALITKEAIEMHPSINKALQTGKHHLANNPAYPEKVNNQSFDALMGNAQFNSIIE